MDDEVVRVWVSCGEVLDEVVLRSYCIGAAHMALGWVTSEGIRVDESGEPQDLTIRSFGILRATEMPPVDVVDRAERRCRRSTAPTRCSPQWRQPHGSRKAAPRTGRRPTRARLRERPMSKPVGPYTPIVRAGDWLVVSGQIGAVEGSSSREGCASSSSKS